VCGRFRRLDGIAGGGLGTGRRFGGFRGRGRAFALLAREALFGRLGSLVGRVLRECRRILGGFCIVSPALAAASDAFLARRRWRPSPSRVASSIIFLPA
jgi:hypothetical protein